MTNSFYFIFAYELNVYVNNRSVFLLSFTARTYTEETLFF